MDDPIESAFQSRCFAHGKSRAKSGRSGGPSKKFNPLAALGRYDVSLGAGNPASRYAFEIHELTEGETGLLGTFDVERLKGMFVLAGSRKQVAEIIAELEEDNDDTGDDSAESRESHQEDTDDQKYELSALEVQDEKLNHRARAFEKNSFRNPKFWMKWKGTRGTSVAGEPQVAESDTGYLVFASNTCDRFEGTITCASLDWKQLKLKGRKIHSNAMSCPVKWSDLQ